jgi:hypothetical protein
MRAYLWTTATIFGAIVLVHLWRLVREGVQVVHNPWYVLLTLLAAVLFGWAIRLLRSRA